MSTHSTPSDRQWHRAPVDGGTVDKSRAPWQAQSAAGPGTSPGTRRGMRVALVFLCLLLLCGLLIWVSLWLHPGKDTALVLIGATYEDNLTVPHNVYGQQGLVALADLTRTEAAPWSGGRLRFTGAPRPFNEVKDWDKDLNKIQEKTILLFISAHGGVDAQGAYLLPNRALLPSAIDPHEADRSRLRLTSILERLKKVPHHRNVVLVLDATRLTSHWPLGMLHNDFARELEKLDAQIADMPNLVVFSSSDVDQRSWTSPELRKTVFAHFIVEGLKGAADGAVDGKEDGHVDAGELYHYVSGKVEEWVRRNRGAAQVPVLLPGRGIGRERARAMHLTIVTEHPPVVPEKNPVFAAPPELVRAWQKFSDLEKRLPAPAVHAPELWARYQQTLLRYEELTGVADKAVLKTLANRLGALEQKILQAETLALNSTQNSLAMPAVSGAELPKDLLPALNQLWDAPEKELAKTWTAIQAKAGEDKTSRQLQRLWLCDQLLIKLIESPNHLERVAKLLGALDDPLSPRPVEAHFAVMLQRDLPRQDQVVPLPAELLQLALRTRILAERAALGLPPADAAPVKQGLYVEQVQPFIRKTVAAADAERRLGEDLLFATEKANWDAGRARLKVAERLYGEAQQRAAKLRAALAARDHLLARLPTVSQWAARRMALAETEAEVEAADQLLTQAERTCLAAHKLVDSLDQRSEVSDADLLALGDEANLASAGLAELERAYLAALEAADRLPPQRAWRAMDDLLSVPAGPAKDRAELLSKKSRLGYQLLNQRDQASPPFILQAAQEKAARRSAEAQGRMALALLGSRTFKEIGVKKGDAYQVVADKLAVLRLENQWRPVVVAAGEQIGGRWQGIPREINLHLARAGKAGSSKALAELQAAERLARQLDASGSLLVTKNTVKEYRQALVQDLLLGQGERTLLDQWYAEDAAKEPYFRTAGAVYLRDAGRHDGVKNLQQRLNQERKLEIVLDAAPSLPAKGGTEPTLHFTSEDAFPLRFKMTQVGETPAPVGIPVVWTETGPDLAATQPGPGRRQVLLVNEKLATSLTSKLLSEAEVKPPPRPVPVDTSLTVKGLYRGQNLQLQTPVQIHPLAQTIVTTHPTPVLGSLAVRAAKEIHEQHGTSKGAVSIVLDCSGSMGPLRGQPKETSKFAEAANAVRQLLQRLPKGTSVSLWVFGQATGLTKTANQAEDTIEPLLPPTRWNPEDAEGIDALVARVQALQPWNESPIARAMYRAAREHLDQTTGYKTMIVVTDGMDNRFDKDGQLNPDKKTVGAFLLENFRDIEVNVIGFRMVSQEEKEARLQFEVVTKLPYKGQFFQVEESRDLTIKMEKLLPQKLTYDLLLDDNRAVPSVIRQGLTISRDHANDRWLTNGLKPGGYQVQVAAKKPALQSVQLDRGDLMLLEVDADKAGRLNFRRLLFSEADYPWKLAKEKTGWRFAVLQNQRVATGLQMLFTLEKQEETQAATLRQWTPAKTWIEVSPPADVKTQVSRRWHYQPNYPAPAWTLDCEDWPVSATSVPVRPTVRAWWSPDAPALVGDSLERKDFSPTKDLVDQTLTVDKEKVIVESVQVERRLVEMQPGQGTPTNPRQLQSCLVVRLSHPRGHPVWAELRGLETKGQEHRYYSGAGKYTAVFWPVTPDQAAAAVKGLEVYSLQTFKDDAEKRGYAVEVPNLYDPQASDVRPLPPLMLPPGRLPEEPRLDVKAPVPPVPETLAPGMLPPPRLLSPPPAAQLPGPGLSAPDRK